MTVGDLCDTISDTYHGEDEKVVLINTSDVLEGKVLNRQAVVNKNLKGQFKKTFKRNDILYSEIRPANKRYAFVDFEDTENYIASTKLMVLRSREDIVRPRFLLSFLSSKLVLKELQQLAETRSGTFPQITFSSELAPIPINIPDLETQDRIVEILDVLERKISTNTEINNYLEESDDTDCEGEWKGNHSFVNDIRNKMTHRNSPNIAVMSDYDMNFKQHPTFIIKRILEDYVTASKYMKEILDEIEKEVMESFDTEQ